MGYIGTYLNTYPYSTRTYIHTIFTSAPILYPCIDICICIVFVSISVLVLYLISTTLEGGRTFFKTRLTALNFFRREEGGNRRIKGLYMVVTPILMP